MNQSDLWAIEWLKSQSKQLADKVLDDFNNGKMSKDKMVEFFEFCEQGRKDAEYYNAKHKKENKSENTP